MARKLKTTPFARFILVMVILAPLAYMGASYYNGEDGLQNLKNLLGIGDKEKTETIISTETKGAGEAVLKLEDEVKYLERKVQELEGENRELQEEIEAKDAEIKALKRSGSQ